MSFAGSTPQLQVPWHTCPGSHDHGPGRREYRMQTRRLAVVTTLVVASLAACHNSASAPKATASSMEADHFDSLAVEASAAGEFDRYRLLTYPIAFLAENGVPATISLNVDGASQPYQAGVVNWWARPPDPTRCQAIRFSSSSRGRATTSPNWSTRKFSSRTLSATSRTWPTRPRISLSTHSPCRPARRVQRQVPHFPPARRRRRRGGSPQRIDVLLGNMAAAFSLFFTPTTGFPNSTFILSSQSLPGIRLVLAQTTGGENRIRALRTGHAGWCSTDVSSRTLTTPGTQGLRALGGGWSSLSAHWRSNACTGCLAIRQRLPRSSNSAIRPWPPSGRASTTNALLAAITQPTWGLPRP